MMLAKIIIGCVRRNDDGEFALIDELSYSLEGTKSRAMNNDVVHPQYGKDNPIIRYQEFVLSPSNILEKVRY